MSSPVEQIKERLSITDVVGSYVTLQKSGANFKAKCPFHNERTPSFLVSPARGTYYCFGCGAKGDILSFVQAIEGIDFLGALRQLGARAGVEITREDPRARTERERLYSLTETATSFFQSQLAKNASAVAYLHERGLLDQTIHSWRLGFAPDAWRECSSFCSGKGYTTAELEKAGLIKSEKGKTYDRFRNRIMFPLFDSVGRVVAFSGRILGKETEHAPKYLNSPETPIFSKSRILYGLDRAKSEIRRNDYAMLVEGQMDLLMCHQAGFRNTVAPSGTALTDVGKDEHNSAGQLTRLKNLSPRIRMVFDADAAGIEASLRSAKRALAAGMEVKIVALPPGTDPAELIKSDVASFKECLRNSRQVIDFYLDMLMRQQNDKGALGRAVHDKLLPLVASIESEMERDRFIVAISDATKISAQAIRDDLKSVARAGGKWEEGSGDISPLSPQRHGAERIVFGLEFWQEKLEKPQLDIGKLRSRIESIFGDRTRTLRAEAEKIGDELIYQAESYYAGTESLPAAADELLRSLEADGLKESLTQIMRDLAEAERASDDNRKNALLRRCQELTQRLDEIASA